MRSVSAAATDTAKKATGHIAQGLKKVDEAAHITEGLSRAGRNVAEITSSIDSRYEISATATKLAAAATKEATSAGDAIKRAADEYGVTETLQETVVAPAKRMVRAVEESETLKVGRETAERAYGATRGAVKDVFDPYFATYDACVLLLDTRKELEYVSACVMQISPAESSAIASQFRRALASKIAGTATVTGLLAVVSALATAGTGTPIATLAGAAAAKATMAWVGGLVGGGVAAGTVLTGGVALVVGMAAYKALGSNRRNFETLSEQEQRLVQTCWLLATICSELAESQEVVPRERMKELYEDALLPLYKELRDNVDRLCRPLDGQHAVAFRQHLLRDFGEGVVVRFAQLLAWRYSSQGEIWETSVRAEVAAEPVASREVTPPTQESSAPYHWPQGFPDGNIEAGIGGAFAALMTRHALDASRESELFMKAIRRSTTELTDASEAEIAEYVRAVAERSEASMRGLAHNVKGIFHEYLLLDRYADAASDTMAQMYESPRHPGTDLRFVSRTTGEVVDEVQIKAVASSSPVAQHLERYPHIRVLVTEEVAGEFDDDRVGGSGFSNEALTRHTDDSLDALHDHTLGDRTGGTAATAALVGSAAEVMQMLRGERAFPDAVLNVAAKTGAAAGATAVTVLLFG